MIDKMIGKTLVVLLLASSLFAQNQKISQLTSGNPPQNADLVPIARSGANYSLTIQAIIAAAVAAGDGTVSDVATGAGLTGGPCTTTCTISIGTGAVTNAMLVNQSVTVVAGSGLSGGGTVPLGGTITLTNTSSGGTVTSVGTTSPLSGTVTTTGNLSCPTCTVTIASGTVALGTSAISSGGCATVITVSATGTVTTGSYTCH